MKWLLSPDGRRALAFAALVGAAMVFTVFAAVGVWRAWPNPDHSFYLALTAHVQVFVVLFAIGALLVKRTVKAGRDGVEISDHVDDGGG